MEMSPLPLLKKKICLLGSFAVGKTSLVRRFTTGIYSDKYLSTIGVKIDRKRLVIGKRTIDLILWDIAGGEREGRSVPAYLQGVSGYVLVGDGTRPETCSVISDLVHFVNDQIGGRPNLLMLNKTDLANDWCLTPDDEIKMAANVDRMVKTSAKTGNSVNNAFEKLASVFLEEVPNGACS